MTTFGAPSTSSPRQNAGFGCGTARAVLNASDIAFRCVFSWFSRSAQLEQKRTIERANAIRRERAVTKGRIVMFRGTQIQYQRSHQNKPPARPLGMKSLCPDLSSGT